MAEVKNYVVYFVYMQDIIQDVVCLVLTCHDHQLGVSEFDSKNGWISLIWDNELVIFFVHKKMGIHSSIGETLTVVALFALKFASYT